MHHAASLIIGNRPRCRVAYTLGGLDMALARAAMDAANVATSLIRACRFIAMVHDYNGVVICDGVALLEVIPRHEVAQKWSGISYPFRWRIVRGLRCAHIRWIGVESVALMQRDRAHEMRTESPWFPRVWRGHMRRHSVCVIGQVVTSCGTAWPILSM